MFVLELSVCQRLIRGVVWLLVLLAEERSESIMLDPSMQQTVED